MNGPHAGGRKRGDGPMSRLWLLRYRQVPWYVVAVACGAILLMGMLLAARYDQGIARLNAMVRRASDLAYQKEEEVLRMAALVQVARTDQFLIQEARTKYGYVFPGEMRFVVTNPEVLGLESTPQPEAAAP
ncbi:MAG TPA: hypothetical protein VLA21_08085 [Candidatus Limnocylindria bacterium]|nr:hypothetical protein [Candidatus Limnocylindria bacterium]